MDWSPVLSAIKRLAPTAEGLLATFGGAPGIVTAGAIKALTEVFGISDKATPDDITKAISTDPQASLKLALAEQDFQVKMRESDIEELKVQLADIQSARQMNIEGVKTTGKRDTEDKVFDWVIVGGFFIILGLFMWLKPEESTNLGLMVGAIIMAFGQVVNFRKGSTVGSKYTKDLLYKSQPVK